MTYLREAPGPHYHFFGPRSNLGAPRDEDVAQCDVCGQVAQFVIPADEPYGHWKERSVRWCNRHRIELPPE